MLLVDGIVCPYEGDLTQLSGPRSVRHRILLARLQVQVSVTIAVPAGVFGTPMKGVAGKARQQFQLLK